MIRRFISSDRANVAMTFGMMALPILTAVGLAVDYSDISRARAEAQSITDAAAIAGAVNQDTTQAQMLSIAKTYVTQAAALKGDLKILSVTATIPSEARLRVEVTARAETRLLRVIGQDVVDFKVTSEAFRGFSNDMEVVFALDTTGSMGGDKIIALRKAAKALVDLLASPADNRVKFGIVPFSTYVNVGMANRNATWISVPEDTSTPGKKCVKPLLSQSECTTEMKPKTTCNDGYCTTTDVSTTTCKINNYGLEECSPIVINSKWNGCVGSRPFPLSLGTELFDIKYPGIMGVSCAAPMLPLTDNIAAVQAKIAAMKASGETYIPAGLLWGLNMLTPGAPASAAKPFDANGENRNPRKSLLLMTDGQSTKSPTKPEDGGAHNGSNTDLANQYTAKLCENAKKLNIEVFTISFQVTDPVTKDMLKKCATDESHFFDADDSVELIFAFTDIAGTLRKVRLSQ